VGDVLVTEGRDGITCPACGFQGDGFQWSSYFCGRCGEHADTLFLEEHPHPETVRHWNRADIIAEYHHNGMPFAAPRSGT
jgi:DNA-directed RNA polymerase subunit RPC12/RpoP